MTLNLVLAILYFLFVIFTLVRILFDTHSTAKTIAYMMLVIILPVIGVLFYFSFGINYRHRSSRKKATAIQVKLDESYKNWVRDDTLLFLEKYADVFGKYDNLIKFQHRGMGEVLSQNSFKLLINGEEKFPEVLKTLAMARHFIHMEYYAWENDTRGNQIKELLLKKVVEGVKIRILYDDYASGAIRKNIVKELKDGGVEIYPNIKVRLRQFANRLNHRDHRKVILVDGKFGFLGGINISDRYDNSIATGLYWRDTHVKFSGPLVHSLQRHFIVIWNSAQKRELHPNKELFPVSDFPEDLGTKGFGQIMAGGPTYKWSTIMLTYFKIFTLAREKIYITNPYFIPNDTILDALKQAAISGVDVRLLLPEKSDSGIVAAASKFYFEELLESGVRIFLYKKGFIHAKTIVADSKVSVIGTANMDIRSFDLNFEMMSTIYGADFAAQLEQVYLSDLSDSREVTPKDWEEIGVWHKFTYSIARLISSFL